MEDLDASLTYVFNHITTLAVSPIGYSLWGNSAGAAMAAAIGSYGTGHYGGEELPKTAAVVMTYTGHLAHASHEPTTFVVAGEEDRIAPPSIMEERVAALREMGCRRVSQDSESGPRLQARSWYPC